jgi:hypothetical protein
MRFLLNSIVLIQLIIGLSAQPGLGQKDSTRVFKNTININVTNPMIFGDKYNVIGYERVIKDYQTAVISLGRFGFPKFASFDTDSLSLENEYNDKGFHVSLEYRFYLKNENKHAAPRGIYLGPYYGFNYFSRESHWQLNSDNYNGEVITNMNMMANLLGVQLGYQFILWKRLTIDMILLGPGWWYLNLETKFSTNLDPEDEERLLEEINDMLEEKFPESDLVIQGGDFKAKKTTSTTVAGLRYMINLGFRF